MEGVSGKFLFIDYLARLLNRRATAHLFILRQEKSPKEIRRCPAALFLFDLMATVHLVMADI